jgi:hypothetical protein
MKPGRKQRKISPAMAARIVRHDHAAGKPLWWWDEPTPLDHAVIRAARAFWGTDDPFPDPWPRGGVAVLD